MVLSIMLICANKLCSKEFHRKASAIAKIKGQATCSRSCRGAIEKKAGSFCEICSKSVTWNRTRCPEHKIKKPKTMSRYESVKQCYTRRKIRAVEYKGGKCQICGYGSSVRSLTFHHRDPKEKEFGISKDYTSWEKTKAELDKCDMLCGNCHHEIHSQTENPSRWQRTRNSVKIWAVECKGGKCQICDYNKNITSLVFHHRDPDSKDFGIGKMNAYSSREQIKIELDKCDLLCVNCHNELHERLAS